jgi:GH24 family phage-related lysozyme (muramidase)
VPESRAPRLQTGIRLVAQFPVPLSFTFNLGQGALAQSTLLKLLNARRYDEVGPQFLRWNNGPNGPMPGLTRRRAAERAMFDGALQVAA